MKQDTCFRLAHLHYKFLIHNEYVKIQVDLQDFVFVDFDDQNIQKHCILLNIHI